MAETVEREITRPAILLGKAVELVRQHVQLAGQRNLKGEEFLLIDHLPEGSRHAGPALVNPREGVRKSRVNEQSVQGVEKFVAGGSMDGPIFGQRFILAQN